MNGVIEFANPEGGRYGVRTEPGGYTVFQLLPQDVAISVDDAVTGDLEALTVQAYRVAELRNVSVFVENTGLTRSAAEAWVANMAQEPCELCQPRV